MSIEIKNADLGDNSRSVLEAGVPAWADDYASGAAFALSRPLPMTRLNVDENVLAVSPSGRTIYVAMETVSDDVFTAAHQLAERVLDLIAVEAYWISELRDPLREYCTWWRSENGTTLRCVSTARIAVEVKSSAVVLTPDGEVKSQPTRSPQRWHASHAYFRRSQTTNNLDDSYRYLFLALESLLSEVYPWKVRTSENTWLTAALRHVVEGYGVDLGQFLEKPAKNPYRRFMKEQYHAQRCALFHAKVSENPRLPGADPLRADLIAATRRLGRLYVRIAGLITGAGFAGGAITNAGFEKMIEPVGDSKMYVSVEPDFSLETCLETPAVLKSQAGGDAGVYHLIGTWPKASLPHGIIRRAGSIQRGRDSLYVEGFFSEEQIDVAGVDTLQCIIQIEMANVQNLRDWFL